MTDTASQPITIDLTQTAMATGKDAIVHYQAFKQLDGLLEEILESNRSNQKNSQLNQSHLAKQLSKQTINNTIFIHGKRGAGKTTFLKSALNHYLNDVDNKILPVAFIDPTVTHTHQHVLVDMIVKINMATENQFKHCSDDNKRRQYQNSLKDMSEGLKLLKNYQPSPADDAQWFLNRALQDSRQIIFE